MRASRIVAMVAILSAAGFGGWVLLAQRIDRSDAAPLPAAQVPVTATTATARDVPIFDQSLGTVQAINTVNVKSRVDGQIMQVFSPRGRR